MIPSNKQILATIRLFLDEIGIETREQPLPDDTFLPGLLIDRGQLLIDPERLLHPGDILHEAGHIAVSLPEDRIHLGGNITAARPDKAGDELAVLLWTYAACCHLCLDLAIVFHSAGYKGQSDWLIEQFTTGQYAGLPLLVWMGLTDEPGKSGAGFPAMLHWLRPVQPILSGLIAAQPE